MKTSFSFFLLLATAIAYASQANAQVAVRRDADIDATLASTLDSKIVHNGDHFLLRSKSTRIGKTMLPPGSVIEGHVENASRATPRRGATMDLLIDAVRLPNNAAAPMHARLRMFSKTKNDIVLKKGIRIRMKAVAKVSSSNTLSAATRERRQVVDPTPTVRPYDEGEQIPF
jgi:hypothetical protein